MSLWWKPPTDSPYSSAIDPVTLRDLLARTEADATAVRRLDQQLIYAPLAAIAGAIYAVAANRGAFVGARVTELAYVVPVACTFVVVLVAAGLFRNHRRHAEILWRRWRLQEALGVRDDFRLDWAFHAGRLIYFGLFLIGFFSAGKVLEHLLTP